MMSLYINPLFLSFTLCVVFMLMMWKLSNRLILNRYITLTRLFLLGAVSFILLGGLITFMPGDSTIGGLAAHNTYIVINQAHLTIGMGMAMILVGYAVFYRLFSFLFKKEINETMGKMHFLGTFIIVYAIFWLLFCLLMMPGMHSQYHLGGYYAFGNYSILNSIITILGLIFIFIQIIPFINAIYSLIYGKRIIR